MNRPKGFTMLELVISIVVVAVLAGIAVPSYAAVRNGMAERSAESSLNNLVEAARAQAVVDGVFDTATLQRLLPPPMTLQWSGNTGSSTVVSAAVADSGTRVGFALLTDAGSCTVAGAGPAGVTAAYTIETPPAGCNPIILGLTPDPTPNPNPTPTPTPTPSEQFTAPAAPSGLLVVAPEGVYGSLELTWQAAASTSAAPVTGYRIQELIGGVPSELAQVTQTSYVASGLAQGSTHTYQVVAYGPGGTSAASNQATATVNLLLTAPATPTGLTSGAVGAGASTVTLSWNASVLAPNRPLTGYRLYQLVGENYSQVGQTGDTAWTVQDLVPGQTYTFKVSAYGPAGESEPSPSLTVSIPLPLQAPNPPSGLSIQPAQVADTSLTLNWGQVLPTELVPVTGYRVFRWNATSAVFEQVAQTSATTFIDENLAAGVEYTYQVATYGDGGQGSMSAPVSGTIPLPLAPAAAPTSLAVGTVPGSYASLKLTWTASVDSSQAPVSGYKVYRQLAGGTLQELSTQTGTDFTDAGLNAGQTYTYQVLAYGPGGNSPYSYPASGTVPSATSVWTVQTGKVSANGNALTVNGGSRIINTTPWVDLDIQLSGTFDMTANSSYGIYTRATTSGSTVSSAYAFLVEAGKTDKFTLRQIRNNVECSAPLAQASFPVGFDPKVPHDLLVVVQGNTLTVSVDGQQVISIPSLTSAIASGSCSTWPLPSGTKYGFLTEGASKVTVTNLLVSTP